jgi:hypothetical protein
MLNFAARHDALKSAVAHQGKKRALRQFAMFAVIVQQELFGPPL